MKKKLFQIILVMVMCSLPCINAFSQQSLWVGQKYTCESTHAGTAVLLTNIQWSVTPSGLLSVTGSGLYRTVTPTSYFSGSVTVKMTCRYKYTYSSNYMSGTERWTIKCVSNPLKISNTSLSIDKGKSAYIGASLTYTNSYSSSVKYSFTGYNSSIVSVSTDGKVTGLSPGTTTVTISSTHSANSCTCTVTVKEPTISVTSVSIPSTAECAYNGGKQLSATILPSNATVTSKTWSSTNTSVAKVNSSGWVTAVSPGACNIYCIVNGSVTSNACAFTVNEPGPTDYGSGVNTWNSLRNKTDDGEAYTIAKNGKWYGTICLPYDCNVENGYIYSIYKVNKSEEGTITNIQFETRGADYQADETHKVEAGMPYLFRRIDKNQPIVFTKTGTTAVDVKAKTLANGLTGTYTSITLSQGSYCLATVDEVQQFYQAGSNVICSPFRAYIDNLNDLPVEPITLNRGIILTLGDDMTTEVSNVKVNTPQIPNGKYLRNGRIIIVKDGVCYNAYGQMLNNKSMIEK